MPCRAPIRPWRRPAGPRRLARSTLRITQRDCYVTSPRRTLPPFCAALPTSWEAVYATQMGTFCAVRPWSLASRRAPWPGWELGCKRPEQPERPAGWAPPCSVAAGPARRIDLGTVRRQRAQTQSCVIARPVASPEPHTRLSRMLSTRYERSPWPVGAS